MKKIYILIAGIAMVLGVAGCSDYLDKPKPTDVLTSNDIYSAPEGVQAYFSGIYRLFRAQYIRTDMGGVYSLYMSRTVKGNDLIQNSWYNFDYAHENREPTYTRVRGDWEFCYEGVKHANTLISEIAKSTALSDDAKVVLDAEAKGLRAFFNFQLYLEYYSKNSGLQTPPLYTEPALEPKGMSTPADFEAQLVSDINDAVAGLTSDRINKSYMNKSVANGLKARILMALDRDWDQIEAAANAAYGGDVASALDASIYNGGFNDLTDSEVMWSMDQQADQSNYYYIAPHAFIDHNQDAYFGTFVNNTFVATFSATDVRNEFWEGYPVGDDDYRNFITDKFAFSFESDMHIMRTAEMVLIDAEANYRNGDEATAHNLLYALQLDRDPNAVKSANTGADLLEEILLERRKELYAEIGVEWFDAKRLGRGITRDGNHRIFVTLEPNDKRFFLKIPQNEIDSNDNIDDSVNDNR